MDLSGALLSGAGLAGARLDGANLSGAWLNGAGLAGAQLDEANLTGAQLAGANLSGARLNGANLSGARLSEAVGLTQAQLDAAHGDASTELPDGLQPPESWTTVDEELTPHSSPPGSIEDDQEGE